MQPRSSSNPGVGELLAYAEFLRALARQLCAADPQGAEDLAQDVWVAALERPPRARGRLAGWLAAVARNLRASRLRRLSFGLDSEEGGRSDREPSVELERAGAPRLERRSHHRGSRARRRPRLARRCEMA